MSWGSEECAFKEMEQLTVKSHEKAMFGSAKRDAMRMDSHCIFSPKLNNVPVVCFACWYKRQDWADSNTLPEIQCHSPHCKN